MAHTTHVAIKINYAFRIIIWSANIKKVRYIVFSQIYIATSKHEKGRVLHSLTQCDFLTRTDFIELPPSPKSENIKSWGDPHTENKPSFHINVYK